MSHFVSKWVNMVYVSIVSSKPVHILHVIGSVNVSCMSVWVLCECWITLFNRLQQTELWCFPAETFLGQTFLFFLIITLITGIIRFSTFHCSKHTHICRRWHLLTRISLSFFSVLFEIHWQKVVEQATKNQNNKLNLNLFNVRSQDLKQNNPFSSR